MKGKGLVLPDRLPIPNPTEDDADVWQALRINEKVHMTQLLLFAIEIMVVKDTTFLCRFSHALLRTPDEFGVLGLENIGDEQLRMVAVR